MLLELGKVDLKAVVMIFKLLSGARLCPKQIQILNFFLMRLNLNFDPCFLTLSELGIGRHAESYFTRR